MATYYQKNRERLLQKQIEYNKQHKIQIQEYFKQYYEDKKEYFLQRHKKIYEKLQPIRNAKKEETKKKREEKKQQKKQEKIDKLLNEEFEETKENIYWELVEKKEPEQIVIIPFQGIKKTSRGFVLEW